MIDDLRAHNELLVKVVQNVRAQAKAAAGSDDVAFGTTVHQPPAREAFQGWEAEEAGPMPPPFSNKIVNIPVVPTARPSAEAIPAPAAKVSASPKRASAVTSTPPTRDKKPGTPAGTKETGVVFGGASLASGDTNQVNAEARATARAQFKRQVASSGIDDFTDSEEEAEAEHEPEAEAEPEAEPEADSVENVWSGGLLGASSAAAGLPIDLSNVNPTPAEIQTAPARVASSAAADDDDGLDDDIDNDGLGGAAAATAGVGGGGEAALPSPGSSLDSPLGISVPIYPAMTAVDLNKAGYSKDEFIAAKMLHAKQLHFLSQMYQKRIDRLERRVNGAAKSGRKAGGGRRVGSRRADGGLLSPSSNNGPAPHKPLPRRPFTGHRVSVSGDGGGGGPWQEDGRPETFETFDGQSYVAADVMPQPPLPAAAAAGGKHPSKPNPRSAAYGAAKAALSEAERNMLGLDGGWVGGLETAGNIGGSGLGATLEDPEAGWLPPIVPNHGPNALSHVPNVARGGPKSARGGRSARGGGSAESQKAAVVNLFEVATTKAN